MELIDEKSKAFTNSLMEQTVFKSLLHTYRRPKKNMEFKQEIYEDVCWFKKQVQGETMLGSQSYWETVLKSKGFIDRLRYLFTGKIID